MLTNDPNRLVGQRLRELRAERGLTVRGLASISDLSFNTISLIERGKMSPTVGTLHKLSAALRVPLAWFVADAPPRKVVFSEARSRQRTQSGDVVLENLGPGSTNRGLQYLIVTLPPGTGSGPEPISHAGHEFAFCLEGRVEYQVEQETYVLEPEDSLLFEASLPHRWRSGQPSPSRLFLIFSNPEGDGVALHRHLAGAD